MASPTTALATSRFPPTAIRLLGLTALTVIAVVVHGYHPYAEDAAIYVAAVKKLVDPSLYPRAAEFFLGSAHLSLMPWSVALSVRVTHLSLPAILMCWYALSVGLTLGAGWRICNACFHNEGSAWYGTALLAGMLTIPVAGTSLLLADPYLTGRSLSTPALLFAIAAVMEHRLARASVWLAVAFLMHPIMAVYGSVLLATLLALECRRRWMIGLLGASVGAVTVFGIASALRHPIPDSYRAAALTRSYLFLSSWKWYELLGLVAPLILFAWLLWSQRRSATSTLSNCALAALVNGSAFILVATALTDRRLIGLARYQPLRSFHLIYALLFLLPVNMGLQSLVQRKGVFAVLVLLATGLSMFLVQHQTFPASPHLEWPWEQTRNPWRQAFDWIRTNTPKDAVFALDPDYMDEPSEDSLGFRAYAERASLADRCTDGGVTVLMPKLAPEWYEQTSATSAFSERPAAAQIVRLEEDGATWTVGPSHADIDFDCPYRNARVAVCRLSPPARPQNAATATRFYATGNGMGRGRAALRVAIK